MRILKIMMFASVVLLSGCVSKQMASWMGHNVNDLIAAWGPPSSTMSDGSGGQILIYDQSRQMVLPATATTTGNYNGNVNATYNQYGNSGTVNANGYGTGTTTTTYQPATTVPINRKRLFWVDSSGTIYRWSWQGL